MYKYLLCATDAGGIKNILPILHFIQQKKMRSLLVTDLRYQTWIPTSEYVDIIYVNEMKSPLDELQKFSWSQVNKLICGVTRYESIDRQLFNIAHTHQVKSVAILDEWYYYRSRFTDTQHQIAYLPDYIACPNQKAKSEAIQEDIPEQLCIVTGNPALTAFYHDFQKRKTHFQKPKLLLQYIDYQIITFISEEFRADYGGEGQQLGEYQGYDEISVLEDLIDILKLKNQKIVLVEKLHPSSNYSERNLSITENLQLITTKNTDLLQLLHFSDLVIGMRSIALLQSIMIGKQTISYQPNLKFNNLCTAVKLNLIPSFTDKNKLQAWLNQIESNTFQTPQIDQFDFIRSDVVENIMNL